MSFLNSDIIKYISDFLFISEKISFSLSSKRNYKILNDAKIKPFYDDPQSHLNMENMIKRNEKRCWYCNALFTSKNLLHKHLQQYNHHVNLKKLSNENFKLASKEDLYCLHGYCNCPSVNMKELKYAKYYIVYTKYGWLYNKSMISTNGHLWICIYGCTYYIPVYSFRCI